MQQFYQKTILDHFICQTELILTALTNELMKNFQNWKIALILVACCQYPWGYVTNLNMASCCVYCIDSYPILRFVTYPQGKKWADIWSYSTECNVPNWKFPQILNHFQVHEWLALMIFWLFKVKSFNKSFLLKMSQYKDTILNLKYQISNHQ